MEYIRIKYDGRTIFSVDNEIISDQIKKLVISFQGRFFDTVIKNTSTGDSKTVRVFTNQNLEVLSLLDNCIFLYIQPDSKIYFY
jgi:hypothetical protein